MTEKWEIIIINEELKRYIKINKLRSVSKFVNFKLKNFNFTTIYDFDILEFNYKGNDIGLSSEDVYNSQLEYINKLAQRYKSRLQSLTIGKSFNYTLIHKLIPNFPNLIKLNLVNISIPQPNFTIILNTLTSLKVLSLSQFVLVTDKSGGYSPELIKFPFSLKKFNFYMCKIIEIDFINITELTNIFKLSIFDNLSNWLIPAHSLINLESLSSFDDETIQIPTLNSLIANNANLAYYFGVLNCIDQKSIDLIATKPKLKTLQLCSIMDGFFCKITNFRELPNITSIEVEYIGYSAYSTIEQLVTNCPNLNSLKLPWLIEFDPYFNRILTSAKQLKTLKIWNCAASDLLKFPLPETSIKLLELIEFNPINFKFELIKNCLQLERIRIEFSGVENNNSSFIENENWRLIFTGQIVNYWKI